MNQKGVSGIEAKNRGYLDLLPKQWKRPFTPEEARKSFGLPGANKGYPLLNPSIKIGGYRPERWNLKVNAAVAGNGAA